MTTQPQNQALQKLRTLADQPAQQAALAAELITPKQSLQVIQYALQLLQKQPTPAARPNLLALYAHYAGQNDKPSDKAPREKGQGDKRDPAANLRATILRVLRPVVEPADAALLARAAETYVFPPPSFKEEGAALRSAALNALNEVDDDLARYHATRLLANEHTDPMSGEPALSAARLLAAQGEQLPLYFYVMQDGARTIPEVIGECLRALTRLPVALLPGVIARYGEHPVAIVLAGLFDLLLNHQANRQQQAGASVQGRDYLQKFLRTTYNRDAYRYLTSMMVAAGQQAYIDDLLALARGEQDHLRASWLREALMPIAENPAVAQVLRLLPKQ